MNIESLKGIYLEDYAKKIIEIVFSEFQIEYQIQKGSMNISQNFDFILLTRQNGIYDEFYVDVKKYWEPKIFKEWLQKRKVLTNHVIIMGYQFSPALVSLCREHHIGYVDFAGNCYIKGKFINIMIQGKIGEFRKERKYQILSSKSIASSKILMNILEYKHKPLTVAEIANLANSSVGQVSNVRKFLINEAILVDDYVNIDKNALKKLFVLWATQYQRPKTYKANSILSVKKMEEKIREYYQLYGDGLLTGVSSANKYYEFTSYNKVELYLKYENLHSLLEQLEAKEVKAGGNIEIYMIENEIPYYMKNNINGFPVVSSYLTIIDCYRNGGRSLDVAEKVIEKELLKHDYSR